MRVATVSGLIALVVVGAASGCRGRHEQVEAAVQVDVRPGIRGVITDYAGRPLAGVKIVASVPVFGAVPDAETVTGADGAYAIALAPGSYRVQVSRDAYVGAGRTTSIANEVRTIDLSLLPAAVIRGRVVTRAGQPVAGAFVSLAPRERPWRGRDGPTTVSGADGAFELRGAEPGTFSISASARGVASIEPATVAVALGAKVSGVEVVVEPAASVSGRVVAIDTLQGLGGVTVRVQSTHGAFVGAPAKSDANGAFTLEGVPAGRYKLLAAADTNPPGTSQSIEVTDHDVTDVTIALEPARTISGRIEPATKGVVWLAADPDHPPKDYVSIPNAWTDDAGRFTLRGARPGRYFLLAHAGDRGGKVIVEVGAQDQANLVVKLEPRHAILGRVIDSNGKPVVGATIAAHTFDSLANVEIPFQPVTTSTTGAFEIHGLLPAKYAIEAWDEQVLATEDGTHHRADAELTSSADVRDVTITLPARDGVLRGTVIDADGKPVPSTIIDVTHESAPWTSDMSFRSTIPGPPPIVTRPDGSFELRGIQSGKYRVIATSPDGALRSEPMSVQTGAAPTLRLAPVGDLTLVVTSAGKPVPEYDIRCDSGLNFEGRARSVDGRFVIPHLPAGFHSCLVGAPEGAATVMLNMTTTSLELPVLLHDWSTVVGTVVDAAKQPIAGVEVMSAGGNSDGVASTTARTDRDGHFKVHVFSGHDAIEVRAAEGFKQLAFRHFEAAPGQTIDLGTIETSQ